MVSHDRDFLDAVVNVIVHIDQKKLRRYTGDYSSFERQRAQALVLASGAAAPSRRASAHTCNPSSTASSAKATKARQAQSRMKMLAKMEDLAPLHVSAPFAFEFLEPLRAPNPLLVLEDVDAGYRGSLAEIGGTTRSSCAASAFRCSPASATACSASTAPASRR